MYNVKIDYLKITLGKRFILKLVFLRNDFSVRYKIHIRITLAL